PTPEKTAPSAPCAWKRWVPIATPGSSSARARATTLREKPPPWPRAARGAAILFQRCSAGSIQLRRNRPTISESVTVNRQEWPHFRQPDTFPCLARALEEKIRVRPPHKRHTLR